MSEIRVNTIVAAEGISAPTLPYGIQVPTGMGITGAGGLNITGVCTATSFSGSGANLTGIAVTETVRTDTLTVAGVSTLTGVTNVTGVANFASAINADATTDSTSTSTGALIVDGGVGIAKNVFIGAGLSVAGTLTYEDVTSVDSVGMVTAKSGVNVSGGQLQVGVAYSVGSAGITTGLGFVCGSSGFNGEAGTSNFGALNVGNAGEFKVGTGVTIASTSGVGTFAKGVHLVDGVANGLKIGDGQDLILQHNGTDTYIDNNTGDLNIQTTGSGDDIIIQSADDFTVKVAASETAIQATGDGSVSLYWNGSERISTTGAGSSSVGISTVQEFSSVGMLKEKVEIVANKLSAGTNVDLAKGNIWYYTTNETTTATPNIRFDGTDTLNNKMMIGETVAVTIISKPNGAGYYAQMTVDSGAQTEEWNGGSAPSSANAGGYDVNCYQITKTANATFLVLVNTANYA